MNPIHRLIGAAAVLVLAWAGSASGAPMCEKKSPAHRVALVELYTSEGCDSCPPADDFVRNLYKSGVNPESAVPLSLHVDYWDYIGWRDRFADAQFTERQYWLGAKMHQHTVYTPQLFVAGREERDWRDGDLVRSVADIATRPAQVKLELVEEPAAGGQLKVTATATGGPHGAPLNLYFAVYENNLTSNVRAGENRGATLRHSFVVRQWGAPVPLDAQGHAEVHWQKAPPADSQLANLGFAAFVEDSSTGEVLQALALPQCTS